MKEYWVIINRESKEVEVNYIFKSEEEAETYLRDNEFINKHRLSVTSLHR